MTISAEGVLRANWREGARRDGTRFAFTCPAPRRYKHQWYWDSCFHAVAWSHIEPARARAELRTLLRAGAALSGRLLRIDLHPADFEHPSHVHAVESVLRRAHKRTAVTYDDLC